MKNIFATILALFVTSCLTTFIFFFIRKTGISCGNKAIDGAILLIGTMLLCISLMGVINFLLIGFSSIDLPYLVFEWLVYLILSLVLLIIMKLGLKLPQTKNTFYIIFFTYFVFEGIVALIILLVSNKKNDKRFDKLKKEIEERKNLDL